MEFELLGWPGEGPKLALDYREFSYAGKFVMSNTGKAVAVERSPDEAATAEHSGVREGRDTPGTEPTGTPASEVDDAVDPSGTVLAAVAFNEDRTDPETAWLRYVTVREDRRGEGIGPRLVSFTTDRLRERGYERVSIAVNNPFAYEALYRAGFSFTGEETGIAELVLTYPPADRSRETYQAGFDVFRRRGPESDDRSFLEEKAGSDPPALVGTAGRGR